MNARDWMNKGNTMLQASQWKEALQAFEKAIEAHPEKDIEAICWLGQGSALCSLSRWKEALHALEKAIETNPGDDIVAIITVPYLYCKGVVLNELSRREEAVKCFDKVIELDPQNAYALYVKYLTLIKIGRLKDAFQVYSEAVKIDPKVAVRHILQQATSLKERIYRKAILKFAEEAIEIYTQLFNSFPVSIKAPHQTQSDESTAIVRKCGYSYWATQEKCSRPLLKGYDKCFWHVTDTKKYDTEIMTEYFGRSVDLKEALEVEVSLGNSLEGAYLREAHIAGNWNNKGPMLQGAILRRADLSNATLSCGSLNGADLIAANMEGAYLSDVDIRNASCWYTNLHNVKFRNNDFAGVHGITKDNFRGLKKGIIPVYHILETYPDQCERMYRELAKYFVENGLFDDASWAAYRGKLMQHRLLLSGISIFKLSARMLTENLLHLSHAHKLSLLPILSKWFHNLAKILASYLLCLVWGYGERPLRVIFTGAFTIFLYALSYQWLDALSISGLKTAFYFSTVTFTTLGYGDVIPKPEFRMFAASEALAGIILTGLFLFTLARRASARG